MKNDIIINTSRAQNAWKSLMIKNDAVGQCVGCFLKIPAFPAIAVLEYGNSFNCTAAEQINAESAQLPKE